MSLYLEHIGEKQNRYRFYSISLQPDLFNGINVVRQWGRIGHEATMRSDHYDSEEEALTAVNQHLKRRFKHQYRLLRF